MIKTNKKRKQRWRWAKGAGWSFFRQQLVSLFSQLTLPCFCYWQHANFKQRRKRKRRVRSRGALSSLKMHSRLQLVKSLRSSWMWRKNNSRLIPSISTSAITHCCHGGEIRIVFAGGVSQDRASFEEPTQVTAGQIKLPDLILATSVTLLVFSYSFSLPKPVNRSNLK